MSILLELDILLAGYPNATLVIYLAGFVSGLVSLKAVQMMHVRKG